MTWAKGQEPLEVISTDDCWSFSSFRGFLWLVSCLFGYREEGRRKSSDLLDMSSVLFVNIVDGYQEPRIKKDTYKRVDKCYYRLMNVFWYYVRANINGFFAMFDSRRKLQLLYLVCAREITYLEQLFKVICA